MHETTTEFPPEGIYLNMPEDTYHSIPAFSKSLVKAFRVSDIDAWESLYGEGKPATEALTYGSALHCLLLEGREAFDARYCKGFDKKDHPDALDTVEEIKRFLDGQGISYPKSASKPVLIELVRSHHPDRPILDLLKRRHEAASVTKQELSAAAYDEIVSREWLGKVAFLADAQATEVSFFWTDKQWHIPCKARLDAVSFRKNPLGHYAHVGDIKTFSNIREKPVADAVAYEVGLRGYHIDAAFYTRAIKMAPRVFHDAPDAKWPEFQTTGFELLFIEKGRPFPNVLPREIAVREFGGGFTELGNAAMAVIQDAVNRYRDLHEAHGTKPWNAIHPADTITEASVPMYFL